MPCSQVISHTISYKIIVNISVFSWDSHKNLLKIKNIHMRKTPYFLFVIYFLENFAKINIYLNSLNAQKKEKRVK